MKKISLRGTTRRTTLLSSPLGVFAAALALCLFCLNGGSNLAFAKSSDGDGGTVAKSTRDDADTASKKDSSSNTNSDTTAKKSTDPKSASPSTEDQLMQLNEKVKRLENIIEQQQKMMEALQNQLKTNPAASSSATAGSPQPATAAETPAGAGAPDAIPAAAGTPAAQPVSAGAATATASGKSNGQEAEAPLQIHIGEATITPIGFVDFTTVFRSTTTGSGIGTNFGSIPFSNSQAGNLTEFRFSPQNSRLGARFDADVHGAHVLGYFETDFLGFVPTNAPVSSNSFSERIRLAFADVRKDKIEIVGGQTWSLMTPNRDGLSPLPQDVFYTQDMDTNYQLGLTWSRQPGFRVIYHAADDVALGFSLEAPEQYIGGTNGSTTVVLPSALAASTIGTEFDSGATTLTVPDEAPDVIAKLAFDPHVADKHFHIEFVGLERNFKDYNPLSKQSFTATGGGGAVNLNLELFKGFHLISNNFYSDGGGRYIFGQAPDFVLRGDGSMSLIHSYSTVDGFEAQVSPKTLFYAYYGGAYIQKNLIVDPATGHFVGYGYPGSSSGDNRALQEPTFGMIQTFWKDPKYGALSLILQYSYLIRSPWVAPAPPTPQTASINMFWIDLRYTLPGQSPHY
ncbi:MAG TPA: hypothetical protein VI756_19445 [Blastocatellia bacterium]